MRACNFDEGILDAVRKEQCMHAPPATKTPFKAYNRSQAWVKMGSRWVTTDEACCHSAQNDNEGTQCHARACVGSLLNNPDASSPHEGDASSQSEDEATRAPDASVHPGQDPSPVGSSSACQTEHANNSSKGAQKLVEDPEGVQQVEMGDEILDSRPDSVLGFDEPLQNSNSCCYHGQRTCTKHRSTSDAGHAGEQTAEPCSTAPFEGTQCAATLVVKVPPPRSGKMNSETGNSLSSLELGSPSDDEASSATHIQVTNKSNRDYVAEDGFRAENTTSGRHAREGMGGGLGTTQPKDVRSSAAAVRIQEQLDQYVSYVSGASTTA